MLATLRSPFLPGYAVFPPLWLATLIAAVVWRPPGCALDDHRLSITLAFTFGPERGIATGERHRHVHAHRRRCSCWS